MNQQYHLFPLPKPVEFAVTEPQRCVLDWCALNDGTEGGLPFWLSRPALRHLIDKGLVTPVGYAPARYMLTGMGRMVRLHRDGYRE